jgi:hypothetical protein
MNTPTDSEALPLTTCSSCLNWEPRQNSGIGDGYCQIFDKFTDPDHGKRCTAFEPNAQAKP